MLLSTVVGFYAEARLGKAVNCVEREKPMLEKPSEKTVHYGTG